MLRHLKLAWLAPLVGSIALAGVLHGCGGGSQTASNNTGGVGSGGTGSYTNGPISGLGSIIVNGVRYDVDSATLLSEDKASPLPDDLQIGMVVEVDGGAVTRGTGGATDAARAARVRYASELIGEVTVLTPGSGRPTAITVMGQMVTINAQTVLPAAGLALTDKVVVYGLPTASGFTATRVDVPSPAPTVYKVSGLVSAVGANTITLGQSPQVIRFSVPLPAGVAAGKYVRVRVSSVPLSANNWTAVTDGIVARAQLVSDQREGRLEGVISNYLRQGTTASGVVNGTSVDFSAVLGQLVLANGLRVEIEGQYSNATLVAASVELDDDSQPRLGETELHGLISNLATGPKTFSLRGITVDYSIVPSSDIEVGLLVNGACVEVKGTQVDASHLTATEVKRDSDCR